jgi:hypothetical protein
MALRMAMVGGGPGSFIGPVHRMAAELDGRIRLVAGVFSRDPAKNAQAAAAWGVAPDRVYPDHHAMIAAERAREDGVDLVSVVTPNHLHFDVSAAALKGGLHVISDKPATLNLAEAEELASIVAASGKLYGLTYTYTGYPMVREAREIVARGDLGAVRKVVVEYSQGWLSRTAGARRRQQAGQLACGPRAVRRRRLHRRHRRPRLQHRRVRDRRPRRAPVRRRLHRGSGARTGRRLQCAAALRRRRARRADRLADLGGRPQRPDAQRLWRDRRPDLVARTAQRN